MLFKEMRQVKTVSKSTPVSKDGKIGSSYFNTLIRQLFYQLVESLAGDSL
jgi:hypothetical protein